MLVFVVVVVEVLVVVLVVLSAVFSEQSSSPSQVSVGGNCMPGSHAGLRRSLASTCQEGLAGDKPRSLSHVGVRGLCCGVAGDDMSGESEGHRKYRNIKLENH